MPHIKVIFLWPYARVGDVHPARAYAYASIPFVHMHTAKPTQYRQHGHRFHFDGKLVALYSSSESPASIVDRL